MKEFDNDCLIMARIQGEIFEKSISMCNSSSSVFIKRYMNSLVSRSMDKETFLLGTMSDDQTIDLINEEYPDTYGQEKYDEEQMYWIGFTYRVWAYVHNKRSKDIIKICSPKKMRELYYPYHTLDCVEAINRILESRGLKEDSSLLNKSKNFILDTYYMK